MNDLELFFAENVADVVETEYVASERFKDKDGNAIAWRLKPLSASEINEIKKKCTKEVPVTGKVGQYRRTFDSAKYSLLLASESVVYPDLKNSKLQDSWSAKTGIKIMDAETLLSTMLLAGEFDLLTARATEVSGYADINEEVEEAKN